MWNWLEATTALTINSFNILGIYISIIQNVLRIHSRVIITGKVHGL